VGGREIKRRKVLPGATAQRRGRTTTQQPGVPISEGPSPEPAAHALFPDTFLSLIGFGTDKASPTSTVTLLTLPETTYNHY